MPQTTAQPADIRTQVGDRQIWAAYLLAWVAAFTDAIGFLTLQQLGASYMSGNSMSLGVALGRGEWTATLNHGLPILSFMLGLLLGVLLLLQLRQWGVRSAFAAVFGLEILCIILFLLVGSGALQQGVIASSQPSRFYTCMGLLTLAMGLQTATVHKIGGQGVRTTFVTGVLSDLINALIQYVAWLHTQTIRRRLRQAVGASMQQSAFRSLLALGGTWSCYVVGALCGSVLEQRLSLRALLLPLGMLALLIALDIVRPFDQ
jgi:uncharacterized membrane protein YoaK (UPF0700 family)